MKKFIQKLSEPVLFKKVMYGVGILFVAFFIFEAGMFVGFHKATFRRDWDDNFARNFGPSRHGKVFDMMPENFPNSHGAIGSIVKIELPTIIVADKDNTEKVVLLTSDTQIRKMRTLVLPADLSVGSAIVVIGSPNEKGQIEARLIRVLPALPDVSQKAVPLP